MNKITHTLVLAQALLLAALIVPAPKSSAEDLDTAAKSQAETPLSIRSAAPGFVSYGQVLVLPIGPDGPVRIPNATSVMQRSRHGVSVSFRTTGLEPDTVYTLWMLVFNNPQFCEHPLAIVNCNPGAGDLAIPAVEGSVLWAAGGISDASGQIELASSVFNDGSTPGLKLSGPGLLDPFRPEVHLVLKRHGLAAELEATGELETALTTNRGCVVACRDVQAAAHLPAGAR